MKPLTLLSLALIAISRPSLAQITMSDESVPLELRSGALNCREAIPDRGFGGIPATVSVESSKIFDRTLRFTTNLHGELPAEVTCADIKAKLENVPAELSGRRLLVREVTRENAKVSSRLVEHFSLEIPVLVEGKNLVLRAEGHWHEYVAPSELLFFPFEQEYVVRTHPRSATIGHGLFCTPSYEGATEHQLSFGVGSTHSNFGKISKTLIDLESCEEVRDDLLKRYQAEDPGNWGTSMKVSRKLERTYRHTRDNEARSMCQNIELETISTKIGKHRFVGVKSFILRTADLAQCNPAR